MPLLGGFRCASGLSIGHLRGGWKSSGDSTKCFGKPSAERPFAIEAHGEGTQLPGQPQLLTPANY